jgi:hypothetical protein
LGVCFVYFSESNHPRAKLVAQAKAVAECGN